MSAQNRTTDRPTNMPVFQKSHFTGRQCGSYSSCLTRRLEARTLLGLVQGRWQSSPSELAPRVAARRPAGRSRSSPAGRYGGGRTAVTVHLGGSQSALETAPDEADGLGASAFYASSKVVMTIR